MKAPTAWSWTKKFKFWLAAQYAAIRNSTGLSLRGSSVPTLVNHLCPCRLWAVTVQRHISPQTTVTVVRPWGCYDSRCWRGCSERKWQKLIASCKILLLWSLCQHKSKVIYDFHEEVLLCKCRNSWLAGQGFPSPPHLLSLCLKGNWGKSGDELCQLHRPNGQGLCCCFLADTQLGSWGKSARVSQGRGESQS